MELATAHLILVSFGLSEAPLRLRVVQELLLRIFGSRLLFSPA